MACCHFYHVLIGMLLKSGSCSHFVQFISVLRHPISAVAQNVALPRPRWFHPYIETSTLCSVLCHQCRATVHTAAVPQSRTNLSRLSSSWVCASSWRTQGHSPSDPCVINTWTQPNTWPWAWVLQQCGSLIRLMRGAHIGQVPYTTGKVMSRRVFTHTAASAAFVRSTINCGTRVSCVKLSHLSVL